MVIARGTKVRKDAVPTLDRDTRAYLAGLFDGEGTVSFVTHVKPSGRLSTHGVVAITMTHEPTMLWLSRVLDRPLHRYSKQPRSSKPAFRVVVSNMAGVASFLEQLRPHLRVKAEAADVMLAYCRSRQEALKLPRGQQGYSAQERAWLDRLKTLNERGVRAEPAGVN